MSIETVLPVAPLSSASEANATITMLQNHSLTGAVQQEIERLINVGELGPGDKLTEAALAERLGVSRGPVREAFRVLEEVGLVQLEKNRGVYVRQIPLEEALEIFDLRAMIEAHVGSTLAANATDAQLANLRTLVTQMEKAVQVEDEATYYRLNVEFHESMVSYAGNKKLIGMYRKLTRELSLFRRRNFSDHALLVTSVNEHRDILDAIGSRNAVKSAEALRQHVLMSRERTIRNFVKYSERSAP
ncbi:MAG: putative HTH-type transcriptional regulator YdfH [Pseudomonadota bacterium]|jgi:phosphonate utilization transcriptional regulator